MTDDKANRIFWLGMHVVLTKTELPRLRSLGFEVFNPPYLTDVYDQSAVRNWDRDQPTTLPPEVFAELSRYSFFYNGISPRIAELLNAYFGTVIVTISPTWLESMLAAYKGRIIYRVFGQTGTLCEALWSMRMFRAIQEREDFHFVPHSTAAVRGEHAWLTSNMTVVPYTLPLDVFAHEGSWSPDEPHAPEIMACCPNIDNAYYGHQYHYLNAHFPEPYLKLYGVQPRRYDDPRVVGTLERGEQLGRYRRSAGLWYHYEEPYVCYLPPVEMMTVGGPVVYMRGSLLARYFESPGPGEVANIDDAKRKLRLLLDGDRGFQRELFDAQTQIVRRYHPDHVHPIFDRTFKHLINRADVPRPRPLVLSAGKAPTSPRRAYLFFHAPGQHITFRNGEYDAADDLARTVRTAAGTLLENADTQVVVTCFAEQLECAIGYLGAERLAGRLRFLVLDRERMEPDQAAARRAIVRETPPCSPEGPETPTSRAAQPVAGDAEQREGTSRRDRIARALERVVMATWSVAVRSRRLIRLLLAMARMAIRARRLARRGRTWLGTQKSRLRSRVGRTWRALQYQDPWLYRHDCVRHVNAESAETLVVVPHPCLFPEALLIEKPIIVGLPGKDSLEDPAPSQGLAPRLRASSGEP